MSQECIQIRHPGGCISILYPNWVEQATLTSQRKFVRFAAQHINDYPENREDIDMLQRLIENDIAALAAEAEKAKAAAEESPVKAAVPDQVRRVNTRLKRRQDLLVALHTALDKYDYAKKR